MYKGYLDTALGKELVAVKTGKGCALGQFRMKYSVILDKNVSFLCVVL